MAFLPFPGAYTGQPELDENGIPIGQAPVAAPPAPLAAPVQAQQPTAPPLPPADPTVPQRADMIEGAVDTASMDTAHVLGNEAIEATNPVRNTKYGREALRQTTHLVNAGATEAEKIAAQGNADLQAAAAAEGASGTISQATDEAARRGEQERAERIALREEHARQLDARVNAVLREPNPGRFMSSATTGQKIGMAAAALLGGWAQHETGSKSNPALDIIFKAVDDDVASQKDLINREQQMLDRRIQGMNMQMEAADLSVDDVNAQKVDRLAAAQALLNKQLAGVDMALVPEMTRLKIQETQETLTKAISDVGAKALDQKERADAAARAAAQRAKDAAAAQALGVARSTLLYKASQGDKDAAAAYMATPGAKMEDLSKAQEALGKTAKGNEEAQKLQLSLPGAEGSQIGIGTATDSKHAELGRARVMSLKAVATDVSELQQMIADQGVTDMQAVINQAARGDTKSRMILQKLARLQNVELAKTTFEEGPNGMRLVANAMGISEKQLAYMVTPDGLNEFTTKAVQDMDNFIGSGAVVQSPEDLATWQRERKNLLRMGRQSVTTPVGRRMIVNNKVAEIANGYRLDKSPAVAEAAKGDLTEVLSGVVADPENPAARAQAGVAIDALRRAGYPEELIKKAAFDAGMRDKRAWNDYIGDYEVYGKSTQNDSGVKMGRRTRATEYGKFIEKNTSKK